MTAAALTTPLRTRLIPEGLDARLLGIVAVLISIGLVMVASASVSYAAHAHGDALFYLKRHAIFLLAGIAAGLVILQVPVNVWFRSSNALAALAVLLLAVVLVPGIGREVNGARRWLSLGPLNLQVAEMVKLSMIVFMAGYLQRHRFTMRNDWGNFFKPLALVGLVSALLIGQPDFGSAVVVVGTVMGLLFLGGVRLWVFTALLGAAAGALGLLAVSSPYRMERLVSFLDPWSDMYNTGYQLTQSLIAFGRGEWLGVGLGNSVQKLFYLPEAHTDFVFAILAEETGLIGVVAVIGLFVALIGRILGIGRAAVRRQDWFAAYTAFGVAILLAGQSFINIGVTSGLLPTKGLTLPFVSYGGSSLLVSCCMVALVLRIGMEMRDAPRPGRRTP